MKTVKFVSVQSFKSSRKYRGVPDDDAKKIMEAYSRSNHGPVEFQSQSMKVSIKLYEFDAVESW